MAGHFEGWGFAVGTVRGIRAWSLSTGDQAGIESVTNRYAWQPGENIAHCIQQKMCDCPECRAERDAVRAAIPHRVERCECGFYAYFGGADEYYVRPSTSYASGVIEGYGQVVLGTKGFRAAKARVLALCLPAGSDSNCRIRQEVTALVAHRFGVPLYETQPDMLAAFPLLTAAEFEPKAVAS